MCPAHFAHFVKKAKKSHSFSGPVGTCVLFIAYLLLDVIVTFFLTKKIVTLLYITETSD